MSTLLEVFDDLPPGPQPVWTNVQLVVRDTPYRLSPEVFIKRDGVLYRTNQDLFGRLELSRMAMVASGVALALSAGMSPETVLPPGAGWVVAKDPYTCRTITTTVHTSQSGPMIHFLAEPEIYLVDGQMRTRNPDCCECLCSPGTLVEAESFCSRFARTSG